MAATYAACEGYDTSRVKEAHRLGSQRAVGRAQTWRTFTKVEVDRDGSWSVCVTRDGKVIHAASGGAE